MAGDLRRLRGDRDKKSVPHCIVHACMNGLFFLTTELHRSFSSYNTFTSLLHHSFGLYITFTTLLHHFYIIPSGISLDIENYCTVSLFFEQTYL